MLFSIIIVIPNVFHYKINSETIDSQNKLKCLFKLRLRVNYERTLKSGYVRFKCARWQKGT